MPVLEKDIENKVVKYFRGQGIVVTKGNVTQGSRGFPDRIFWIAGGKPILIEFKRPGKKPSQKQKVMHDRLRRFGYNVFVIDSAETGIKTIEDKIVEAEKVST